MGYEPIHVYAKLFKYGKGTCDFLGRFYFSLSFPCFGGAKIKQLGSLSTRTFKATPPSFKRLRLGRGLLRMTYSGLPTLCCRRRRELTGFGGVVKVVSDLSGSYVFIVCSPSSSG